MSEPRWGLTLPLPGVPLSGMRDFVEQAEAEGYTDLFKTQDQ
ncbi:MAG: hypothetical protein ACO3ZZ_08135 [Solirubrobacterales bacterium]